MKYYFFLSIFLILLDQTTKILAKGYNFLGFSSDGMAYGDVINVIGDIVTFVFVENPGIAFGIEFGWGKIFLSIFTILACIGLGLYLSKLKNLSFFAKLGMTLIFSGAFGNMIDRVFYGVIYNYDKLFYGKVVDFIRVDIPDLPLTNMTHWPVFNVADSCVSCGVVILLFFHKELPSVNIIFNKKSDLVKKEIQNENIDN